MNYEELVKALRHCADGSRMDCAECEYEPYYDCTARLIKDAAAAIEALQAMLTEADKKQAYQHDCICELTAENEELQAEVQELKRMNLEIFEDLPKMGEWIDRYDEDDKPFFKRKYVCSACGGWNTYGKSKYCPKCGAKMEVQE